MGTADHHLDENSVRAALIAGDTPVLAEPDIAGVAQEPGWLAVTLSLESPARELLRRAHRRLVESFPGVEVELRAGRRTYRGGAGFGAGRHVIAVLGGKGGVGKSTIAVNLALTFAAMGQRAGLLDADINAPDVPHMLGVSAPDAPRATQARGDTLWSPRPTPPSRRRPPELRYGIEVMSVGFAVPERYAPRITSRMMSATLLNKLVFDTAWEADVLVVDAPPGTGEELRAIAGELPLSGALFVTTPQDLAQLDAERTLSLLAEHDVPVIGLVKNMASMACPHCEQRIDMFAGSERLRDAGVPVIAEVPFDVTLSAAADRGVPLVLADPRGGIAFEFARIGASVRRWLKERDDG